MGQSGNPGGRPKGARNKLANDFVRDFYDPWNAHGATALERMAHDDPTAFVNAAIKPMPTKLEIDVRQEHGLSDKQFDALVEYAQAEIAKLQPGMDDPASAKPLPQVMMRQRNTLKHCYQPQQMPYAQT
jgi:hypothetical protein